MTVPAVLSRHRRHARPHLQGVRAAVSRRIPPFVNTVWDWAENDRGTAVSVAVSALVFGVLVAVSPLAVPALCAIGGAVAGGSIVGVSARIASTEQRHTITRLEERVKGLEAQELPPVDASASEETQKIWPLRGDR